MDFKFYRHKFQQAMLALESQEPGKKGLRIAVVEVLNSVVLKLYKETWANRSSDPLTSPSRIFFAIWVNEKTLKRNTLSYNIHALKLRQLQGYAIESRAFAESFRTKFRRFESDWPNVSTDFGPLTLMEGWQFIHETNIEETVTLLANKFFAIDHLVDDTLMEFKRKG